MMSFTRHLSIFQGLNCWNFQHLQAAWAAACTVQCIRLGRGLKGQRGTENLAKPQLTGGGRNTAGKMLCWRSLQSYSKRKELAGYIENSTILSYYNTMDVLVLYLGMAVIGYFIGAALRKKNIAPGRAGIIQTVAITALVFVMGSRIGADREIVGSLDSIGLTAFIMTVFILAGSVAAVFAARKLLGFDKQGNLAERADKGGHAAEETVLDEESEPVSEKADHTMTICIIVSVIAGILAGYFVLPQGFIDASGTMIVIGLCVLLLFVGIDIGTEGTIIVNFRRAGWRIFVFPAAIIVGTLAGSAICALFMPISVQDALCIGAGFGWYTLAPAMLADYSVKVSAISFMHNVMRELFGILLIPVIARKIGYIETVSLPGAAAMDVCLPIVEKSTRSDIAVYSFISGVILSVAVPVMVSFMMGI